MFILYEYTKYPIWKNCRQISQSNNVIELMNLCKNKGHKFFINNLSYGGTYYRKKFESEKWECVNNSIPIKNYTF